MRIKYLFATTMVVAIFLSSCDRKYVSLDFTSAKGEVPQLGNLIFRFNKALMPDSLINTWDSTDYIRFEPEIKGKFRWQGPDELVFSPAQPLAPATNYKAKITTEVLRFSKYNTIKDADKVSFHTTPLELSDAQVTWTGSGNQSATPQLVLSFNYLVQPAAVKEKLHIEVDGEQRSFSMVTASPSKNIVVVLDGFRMEDKTWDAKMKLDKGLLPAGGHKATDDPLTASFKISSPYELTIHNIEAEHDGTEGTVHLFASQHLSESDIAKHISFTPSVSFRVEQSNAGIIIRSERFDVNESYTIDITNGIRGKVGGVLKEDYQNDVAFGELDSEIRFTNKKAVYLSKLGNSNIEVLITNAPKIKLIISRIYENNLLMAHRNGYTPKVENESDDEGYEDNGYQESNYIDAMAGDVIFTKEIDTKSLPKSGNSRILNLAKYTDRLTELKGIYHVELRSAKDYWVQDGRFISMSDIGLIAKQGPNNITVFANSIRSASGMGGVKVNIYGLNNQLLGTGTTNSSGVADIAMLKREYGGFKPAMIIAKTSEDFTYLPFNNTRVNTSRFDVGGKRGNSSGLDAFVYAERDIYRPGEKVNFAVVVRDQKWKSPGDIPVQLKFLLPNGKEFKSFRKALNDGGTAEGSIDIPASAITGSYLLEVYSSNGILLSSKSFMIEEFVPDRIKVAAKIEKPSLRPGESTQVFINAVNFFGPPAAGRNYEMEVQVKQKSFNPKNFTDYDFSLATHQSFSDKQVSEGVTDAAGNAVQSFKVPEMYFNAGLLQANFYTTVFDETGRPVSKTSNVDIFTQDIFNGVQDEGYGYYSLNQPVKFKLVSVNKDGAAVNASTRITVIRHEYKTSLVRSGGYFRYDSQKETKILVNGDMMVGNGTAYVYIPKTPGDYEVRISRPGSPTYVARHFYAYGGWGSSNAFEVNNEGHIDITADKENYKTGETAKVLFKAPFNGRMLVTTEREGMLSYEYLVVRNRTASMEIKMNAAHVPNVYITATLFKPHEDSDIPLTVAHGFNSVSVDEPKRKLAVQITAKQSTRSNTKQDVRIKTAPGSYVTLAAVDNGVLQVGDFKTPDPYNYFYEKKALGVNAFDIYPLLFPELRTGISSTGGDGDEDLSKRNNPIPAKRFKIMSYWSGIKKADANGNADFSFNIPQFTGQIRLMAVVSDDEKFGSAESTVQVADPVVISAALPRFLSPGDTAWLPVTLSNTTAKAASGTANVNLSGPLRVIGSSSQAVNIPGNTEARVEFRIVADHSVNTGKISLTVSALGEKFMDHTEISIRPASTLQKVSGSGSVTGNTTQQLVIPKNDFMDATFNYELVVSRSPVASLADQLRYLVQYPYGCTEQTVSSAFPQLYYADFADLVNAKSDRKANANANVMEAIRKIKMRQLYNGAVTLWDGEGEAHWWTTIYAAHFLLEARKAGFDVDASLVETMLGYLVNRLKTKETINYYYNRDQNKKIAPKEVSYSLYVLALANKTQVPAMNYYKSNPQLLALDSRYLLSAAYAVAGDRKAFRSFLPASFSGELSNQETGGSFYSATRDEAIALSALVDVDPGNAQIPVMAQHVSNRLKSEAYLNTQERAFSFLALGKIARTAAKSDVVGDIRINGKTIAQVGAGDWKANRAILKSNQVEIVTKGNGRLYYSWVAEGISTGGGYKQEDNYIKVRRNYFDRNGKALKGNSFRQNDLIIVQVTLENAYSNRIENIVITDLLPAGFEIENPRTKELPGMDWIKNAWNPVSIDMRDDRIHLFVDAGAEKQTYYYAVRAVSAGVFRQGPVSADAMYDGAIHSYHGAGVIRVTSR